MATYTEKEWREKARKLHGDNPLDWKFQCPSCQRVQTARDFPPYKDRGANANDAYQKCLGRYTGGRSGPHGCDWCSFGLFAGPDFVVAEEDGKEVPVFPIFEGDEDLQPPQPSGSEEESKPDHGESDEI